jgi:ribosomal protein S27AE
VREAPVLAATLAEVTCAVCLKTLRARGVDNGRACTKCGTFYPPHGFYRDKKTGNLASVCKFCQRTRALKWRYQNHERTLDYMAVRRKTPEELARNRAQARKSEQRYPERWSARKKVARAVRSGALAKLPCVKCGDPRTQAHHHDYSRPLEVEWLCQKCHALEHRTSDIGHAAAVRR